MTASVPHQPLSGTGVPEPLSKTTSSTGQPQTKYVIITPVRNEEKQIEQTILSVLQQTVLPSQWILVNDGSQDRTGQIIDEYARRYSWITPVHRSDRGFRQPGTGVVTAFYDGYRSLTVLDWNYVVKLDGDLVLEPDYFEKCFHEFSSDPQLGIGGGLIGHLVNGTTRIERSPLFHVRGATKIYRRGCWEAIGGLLHAPGWDTVDELKANMLGWRTRTFPHILLMQTRPTGARNTIWGNAVKNGRANYVSGYHPLFMFLKCVGRARQKPYVIGGAALLYGYLEGFFQRIPRVQDPELIRYTRKQQLQRLLLRESIWQ